MALSSSTVAILLLAAASLASANHNTNFPPLDFRFVRDRVVPAVQDLLQDRAKIGTVVRFAFHECTGGPGCDGCLDPNQGRNVGLEGIQRDLDNIYSQLRLGNNVMSRADFYMLAGLIAANSAVPRGARMPLKLRIESFRWGRRECATSPMAHNDNGDDFPGPNMNWDENMAFFNNRFGFNERETVAINGAHNLGRAHPQFTGFNGQWARDNDQLSGSYFQNLRDRNQRFTQVFSNNGQWTSRAQNGVMMLNTDLVLYRDLGDTSDGRSVCPSDASQCRTVPTQGVVDEYADNPQRFLDDFADVYTKMMEVCARDARGNPIRDPQRGGCNLRNMSNLPADDPVPVASPKAPKPCRKKRCPVVDDLPGDDGNGTPSPKPCKKKKGCPAPDA